MVISTDDLKFKLLHIFQYLRIPAGGKLTQTALIQEWARTRLRKTDLLQVTNCMLAEKILLKETAADEVLFQLTAHGFSCAAELRGRPIRNSMRKIRIGLMLSLMRNNYARNAYRRHSD